MRHARKIDADLLDRIPLSKIDKVVFYKRDELTTDLICCEVRTGHQIWSFHEEMAGWNSLLSYLEELPGFHSDWYSAVSYPPFAESRTIAYSKA